jgi:hypothetical protein
MRTPVAGWLALIVMLGLFQKRSKGAMARKSKKLAHLSKTKLGSRLHERGLLY